jgi:hypothetical protein
MVYKSVGVILIEISKWRAWRGEFVGIPLAALFVLIFYGSPLYPDFYVCRDLQLLFDG